MLQRLLRSLVFAGRHAGELLEDGTEGTTGRKTRFEADGYDLNLHYRMRGMLRILAEMLAQCRKSVPYRDARSPHYPDPFLKHPPFHQVHFSSFSPARFNRRAPYTAPAASSSDMPPSMGTKPSPSEGSSWENALRCNASRIIVMSFFMVLGF